MNQLREGGGESKVSVVGGGGGGGWREGEGEREKVQTGGRQSVSGLYCYSVEGSKTVISCNDLHVFFKISFQLFLSYNC